MTIINIEIDIFDDPEFCCTDMENTDLKICKYSENGDCWLFFAGCMEYEGEKGEFKYVKTPKCKTAYQKAQGTNA